VKSEGGRTKHEKKDRAREQEAREWGGGEGRGFSGFPMGGGGSPVGTELRRAMPGSNRDRILIGGSRILTGRGQKKTSGKEKGLPRPLAGREKRGYHPSWVRGRGGGFKRRAKYSVPSGLGGLGTPKRKHVSGSGGGGSSRKIILSREKQLRAEG